MTVPAMVKMVNVGRDDFKGRYKQRIVTIPSGSEAWLEGGAAVAWFGNPDVRNEGRVKDRDNEYKRIRIMWMGSRMHEEHLWERLRPQVEVYTPEGERYFTVADDPHGENLAAETGDETTDTQINALRAELAAMSAALNNLVGASANPQAPDDLPPLRDTSKDMPPIIPGVGDEVLPSVQGKATSDKVTTEGGESSAPPVDTPKVTKKG